MTRPANDLEITSAGAIEYLLEHCHASIRVLIVGSRGQRFERIRNQAKKSGVPIEERNQEGLRALMKPFPYRELGEWLTSVPARSVVLVLDHLVDPQNFGAICRTAEALGVHGVIIPKDRSVDVTPGVYHASVGAVASLPVVKVVNLASTFKRLRDEGFWIVGTALSATSTPPKDVPDFERVALVLGAEGDGMSEKLIEKCDWHVKVPLSGTVPSLNVSVAAAILTYEFTERLRSQTP